ncbi:orotidine-5'-phosphate decarboxylase [Mycoplasmatota bacterium]|nr:orotidine-5'-phosphate decarboxylase [Mycoplasmatota bacterium]
MMNNVIIACDFENRKVLTDFLKQFEGKSPYLKIGMELFYGEGPDIVREIKDLGFKVFLDLKLHDIPNTVRKAMRNCAKLGVDIVNLHAAGTIEMMKAAKLGLEEGCEGERPLLIAVTQLTSTSEEVMNKELLINETLENTVKKYALNAKEAGLDGVVCSPLEAKMIHETCGNDFITVTPGIRLASNSKDDQVRVTTPELAKELGSDFIVVGRSITASENPLDSYEYICEVFNNGK